MKSGQQESRFSLWTIALADQVFWFALAFVFVSHLFLSHWLPPTEDELYYWAWSKKGALSYFDHPPMIAWWIKASTFLWGDSIFAIRFPAVLAHLFILYRLGMLCSKKLIPTLLLLSPISLFGAILMTPDIPLLFFWFLYLCWISGVESSFSNWSDDPVSRVYRKKPISTFQWAVGGALLGLGLLSKYTMGLAPLCFAALMIIHFRFSAWITGFLFHLLIALLLFSPVIIFNYHNDFAPFLFQWNHTKSPVSFGFLWTFLGGQIVLVGALPFLFLPGLLMSFGSFSRVNSFRTFFYFYSMPLAFFLFKSTHHFLEANWSLVTYLSFWPLASLFYSFSSFKRLVGLIVAIGFCLPITVSAVIAFHLIHPIARIPAHQDRFNKLLAQKRLVLEVSTWLDKNREDVIYLPTYQWTSYFKFYGFPDARQLAGVGRPSEFTQAPQSPCQEPKVLYFQVASSTLPDVFNCFQNRQLIKTFELQNRETKGPLFELWEFAP